ncbi:MAG: hypothetical protein SGI86_00095 [Deltaproteobacteria bacterium]|nr:hypothetical protein [Deltaproteobacteria bacterium]
MILLDTKSNFAEMVKRFSNPGHEAASDSKVISGVRAALSHVTDEVETTRQEHNLYGNHGGPGSKPGTENMGKPVDKLDEAFQAHDRGYGRNGYFDLSTDLTLIAASLGRVFAPDASWRERAGGLATVAIFGGAVTPIVSVPVSAGRAASSAATSIASSTTGFGRSVYNSVRNLF